MESKNFWRNSRVVAGFLLQAACAVVFAQSPAGFLSVAPPAKISAKRGAAVEAKINITLQQGYHVNSNTPSESYLIPLKLTWTAGPLQAGEVAYPKPHMQKYQFSETPLSVFTGDFAIVTKFKAPQDAPVGPAIMAGKLRYQACNDSACFPPKTLEVSLPVQVQ